MADPLERGNLIDRHAEIFADLRDTSEVLNSEMLPYEDINISGGFDGGQMADRYGIEVTSQ